MMHGITVRSEPQVSVVVLEPFHLLFVNPFRVKSANERG